MRRNITVLNVFVASPGDVQEERNSLESIVNEVNQNLAKHLGLRLELIRWETNVTPGFGSDPQDVINKQIGDDYDIFIGILWARAGTPTPRAESGTIEEFERAYQRHLENSDSIDLLIYFKESSLPLSNIDIEQLVKIRRFRDSLGAKGGLYWTFDDVSNFETLLRTHLSHIARKWREKIDAGASSVEPTPKIVATLEDKKEEIKTTTEISESIDQIDEDADYGFIDYIEIYGSKFGDMNGALDAFSKATNNIAAKINKQKTVLEEANRITDSGRAFSLTKKALKTLANDLNNYSKIIENNNEIFSEAARDAFGALGKATVLYNEGYPDDKSALDTVEAQLTALLESHTEAYEGMAGFRDSVLGTPKFTIQFNQAKRRTATSLDRLLNEIKTSEEMTRSVLDTIRDLKK